jgi:hypothetical protein
VQNQHLPHAAGLSRGNSGLFRILASGFATTGKIFLYLSVMMEKSAQSFP